MYTVLKTMKYDNQGNKDYIHSVVDELVLALERVGVTAYGKKFDNFTNISTSTGLNNNSMPSWLLDLSDANNVTFKVSYGYSVPTSYNPAQRCLGCVYWEVDGYKYAYFMGGSRNASTGTDSYNSHMLVQSIYTEDSTLTKKELTIGMFTGNYSSTYAYFGVSNVEDKYIISKTTNSFHIMILGKNTTTNSFYAGQCKLSHDLSVIYSPKYRLLNKYPVNNNLTKECVNRSLSNAIYDCVNPTKLDLLTGKAYTCDVFVGVVNGTVLGTIVDAITIPRVNYATGNIISVGGEMYMSLTMLDYNSSYYEGSNPYFYVKV